MIRVGSVWTFGFGPVVAPTPTITASALATLYGGNILARELERRRRREEEARKKPPPIKVVAAALAKQPALAAEAVQAVGELAPAVADRFDASEQLVAMLVAAQRASVELRAELVAIYRAAERQAQDSEEELLLLSWW